MIEKYIGIPWTVGSMDCWWLVREVYKQELGVTLPTAGVNADNHIALVKAMRKSKLYRYFERLQKPEHLCVVVLGVASPQEHVGVYVEGTPPMLLHNHRGSGVVAERFDELPFYDWQIYGYYKLKEVNG